VQRLPGRRTGPAQRRLEGGQSQLVDAQSAGERVPAQPLDDVAPAEQQARLWPAEQLVTAGRDQRCAGAQGGRRVGLVGQQRLGREQPRPDVDDERNVERGEVARRGADVKPDTTKFEGCTLRTKPVSGPIAAA
jgi:hypothetical protein